MRVKLVRGILWPDAKEGRVFEREIDLPFAPYRGLTIWFGEIDDDDERESFTVQEVDYSLKTQAFECTEICELREREDLGVTIPMMVQDETEDALKDGFTMTHEGSSLS